MKISPTLVASAVLSLFLSTAAAQSLTPCGSQCAVTITMSAGCGSGIKVAPDPIVVAAGSTVEITWTIATPGWAFDRNGIFIHQPGEAFDKGGTVGGGKSVKLNNKNTKPQAYKYDVNLIDERKQRCKLDPTVVNQ